MFDNEVIEWLLNGDVSIQYQVYRDLLKTNKPALKETEWSLGIKVLSTQMDIDPLHIA